QHTAGVADADQVEVRRVADGVLQRAAVAGEGADGDAVAVGIARLHGVAEHQGAAAAAGDVVRVDAVTADVEQQPWRTAGGVHGDGLAEVDGEGQHAAGGVGAGGRDGNADDRRVGGIDQQAGGGAAAVEGNAGGVAGGAAAAAAVGLDGAADGDAVAVGLAAGDGEAEHQGAGAGAGDVVGE